MVQTYLKKKKKYKHRGNKNNSTEHLLDQYLQLSQQRVLQVKRAIGSVCAIG